MNLLPRRSLLAVAAVVDIAHHARPSPIAAKTLAARHSLPPRHLETLLQVLVRAGILKGVRGPRGGYELARERRKITVADIIRAASGGSGANGTADGGEHGDDGSPLVRAVVVPAIAEATDAFLERLDLVTIEDLCDAAQKQQVFAAGSAGYDFTI